MRYLALVAVVLLSLVTLACDPIREINKGAYRAQAVIHQIPPALIDFETQGTITRAQEKDIARAGDDLNNLNNEFIALLRPALNGEPVKWNAALKAKVIAKLEEITTALERLNTRGTLHIKNEAARATFDGFIKTLRTILASVREAL